MNASVERSASPGDPVATRPSAQAADTDGAKASDIGIGIVAPYDFALDRELWRWTPDGATLHLTRTAYSSLPVTVEQARLVSDASEAAQCTLDLLTVEPRVVAFACTSGSFVGGRDGERALVSAMTGAGAPDAVTTSGALVEALAHLGATRLGIATPYDAAVTERLHDFLGEVGVTVSGSGHLGLSRRIWTVAYATTRALVREVASSGCQAVFVSCTNLPTYDLIADLEAELGLPVLTANQVTMWASLRRLGLSAVGPGQALLASDPVAPQGSSA